MKTHSSFVKLIAVIAILMLVFSFAACKGSLKLESFTVDRSSVKVNYLLNEEIDFSGIKATAKYSDESLNKVYTFSELTITYADDITATEGEKYVTVSFDDPHLNVKQEAKVKVTVTKDPIENTKPLTAVQFQKPSSLVSFDSDNKNAGTSSYGDASFSGEFAVGGKTYVIGDDNEFRFVPKFSVLYDNGAVSELSAFYGIIEISVEKSGSYVALTTTAGEGNMVSYYDGETCVVTVDTYNGLYDFTDAAIGSKVKISVLPSTERYIYNSFNAVVLEAKVIDAYNVYEAWQLSVIDNNTDRTDWDEIKTANGIAGLNVNGIVLHNDIKVTADDVPASFLLASTKDVVYTNTATGATKKIPAGTKFLKDWTEVYYRNGTGDFVIQGNFFTIDTSEFPLVPSPGVFGKDSGFDYGNDFSNSTLIKFVTTAQSSNPRPSDVAEITINNISMIGNAKRDNYVDSVEKLASAGGLIFIKASHHSEVTINNSIGNSFFITYFPDGGGDLTANNVKCYDSYQNAAMVWGESTLTFNNSFLDGCGGPVIIAQSVIDDDCHPTLIVNNTVINTSLSGEEIWFTAVNATTVVGQIKGLGQGLAQAGIGNFVDSSGKMNIKGLLMASGSDAELIIGGVDAQGSMAFDKHVIDRNQTNASWQAIYGHPYFRGGAPVLTVYAADGTAHSMIFAGTDVGFVDVSGKVIGTDASHGALLAAFGAANQITLTQGGISVVFEFYH